MFICCFNEIFTLRMILSMSRKIYFSITFNNKFKQSWIFKKILQPLPLKLVQPILILEVYLWYYNFSYCIYFFYCFKIIKKTIEILFYYLFKDRFCHRQYQIVATMFFKDPARGSNILTKIPNLYISFSLEKSTIKF